MYLRKDLIDACHKVYQNGFVSAFDGNLSLRIDQNHILITPSARSKGELQENDLMIVDYDGNKVEGKGKVSTEVLIHLLAYKKRKEVNAVVHCHPTYATAFAAVGEDLSRPVFPEVILTLGKIPLCKYATPSTDELPNSMLPHIDYAWAFLLENHGAVTLGKSIRDAYFKMEKLEHFAKILFAARQIGREKSLPLLKLKELYEIAEDNYGLKIDKQNRLDY